MGKYRVKILIEKVLTVIEYRNTNIIRIMCYLNNILFKNYMAQNPFYR